MVWFKGIQLIFTDFNSMTQEEIKLQVAISCIQGIIEAKHGIIGEVLPQIAVKESLRIADEFVKQWFKTEEKEEDLTLDDEFVRGWNESRENILKYAIEGTVFKIGNNAIIKEKDTGELINILSPFNDRDSVLIAVFKDERKK